MTRPELLWEARSVEHRTENVGAAHADHVPEEDGEQGILETIQNKEVDNGDHGVAGHDSEGASAHGAVGRRAELGRGHYAHIQHIQHDHDDEVHLHVGRVAVEAVVDDWDIRAGDEDADAAVVERLEDVVSREAEAVVLVENETRTHAPNSTGNENHEWPVRDLLLVRFVLRHCYKVHKIGRHRLPHVRSLSGGDVVVERRKVLCRIHIVRQSLYAGCLALSFIKERGRIVGRGAALHNSVHSRDLLPHGVHVFDGNGVGEINQEDEQQRSKKMRPHVHRFIRTAEHATPQRFPRRLPFEGFHEGQLGSVSAIQIIVI